MYVHHNSSGTIWNVENRIIDHSSGLGKFPPESIVAASESNPLVRNDPRFFLIESRQTAQDVSLIPVLMSVMLREEGGADRHLSLIPFPIENQAERCSDLRVSHLRNARRHGGWLRRPDPISFCIASFAE